MNIPMCSHCRLDTGGSHEWNCPFNRNNSVPVPRENEEVSQGNEEHLERELIKEMIKPKMPQDFEKIEEELNESITSLFQDVSKTSKYVIKQLLLKALHQVRNEARLKVIKEIEGIDKYVACDIRPITESVVLVSDLRTKLKKLQNEK